MVEGCLGSYENIRKSQDVTGVIFIHRGCYAFCLYQMIRCVMRNCLGSTVESGESLTMEILSDDEEDQTEMYFKDVQKNSFPTRKW